MFYSLLRSYVKFGLQWYIADWRAEYFDRIPANTPSLIVANHPNSFFDALLIAVHMPGEIRFLTRGDLFEKPLYNWLLRSLFMLPIYKKNDAEDTQVRNAFTYEACALLLKEGKHILIFPEGRSRNKFDLQNFMFEGTDRLLEICYRKEIPVQIQPFALDYSSFSYVPKSVRIKALPPIDSTDYIEDHAIRSMAILEKVQEDLLINLELKPLAPKIIHTDLSKFLLIPAKIGYYSQYWFYQLWRNYIRKKTAGTIFYDSLLFGCLLFSYPLFVLMVSVIFGILFGFGIGLFVFLFLPFTAYCMAKRQKIKIESDLTTMKNNHFSK